MSTVVQKVPRPAHMLQTPLEGLRQVKALFVDIDDTILTPRPGACGDGYAPHTGSLMDVLRLAGVRLGGLTLQETESRMQRVRQEIKWWHWSDFIVALELNPKAFWEFAYETERQYLQPTGPEIAPALSRLRAAGYLLYVTSNNPSSGILHKLRLAGLGTNHGCDLFHQLLGGTELHAMKCEPVYWHKALAHAGLDAAEVAVVGDNLRDDWEVPSSVGIEHTFLINRNQASDALSLPGLRPVRSFDEVASMLLAQRK